MNKPQSQQSLAEQIAEFAREQAVYKAAKNKQPVQTRSAAIVKANQLGLYDLADFLEKCSEEALSEFF